MRVNARGNGIPAMWDLRTFQCIKKISRIKDFDDQNAHTDQKERKKEVKIKREPRLKKGEHLPRV